MYSELPKSCIYNIVNVYKAYEQKRERLVRPVRIISMLTLNGTNDWQSIFWANVSTYKIV